MIWRWSLLTAGLIALFWIIWYLINGEVPVVENIVLNNKGDIFFQLPFAVSRWYDIFIGPIGSVILISLFTNKKISDNEDFGITLTFGLVFGLIYGLIHDMTAIIIINLVCGLIFGPIYGLIFGLVASLTFGLTAGLVYSFIISLVFGLIYGLTYVIRHPKLIFSTVDSWLLAKN